MTTGNFAPRTSRSTGANEETKKKNGLTITENLKHLTFAPSREQIAMDQIRAIREERSGDVVFSEPGDRQGLNHLPRDVALTLVGHRHAFLANLRFVRGEKQIASTNRRPLQPVFLTKHGFELTSRKITRIKGLASQHHELLLPIDPSLI